MRENMTDAPTREFLVVDEVMFQAEVFVLGVVNNRRLAVPLGPQHLRFPLELDEQGVYLAVFGHLQSDLTRNPVATGESVCSIDRVVGDF